MKKIILLLFLFIFASQTALSVTELSCVGMDTTGKTVHLIFDIATNSINLNGEIHKAASSTRDKKGFCTENYLTTDGVLVYDSFMPQDKTHPNLFYQFNAVTNKVISVASFVCH